MPRYPFRYRRRIEPRDSRTGILRRDCRRIFLVWFLIPVSVFGSTWGEETQHTWYSVGGRSIGESLISWGANDFGKIVRLGIPVYDFSIGLGARIPLNTGSAASPLMLARYLIPNDVIAPLYVAVIAYAATVVVSSAIQLLGTTSRTVHGFVLVSLLSVPLFYVTRFDWYSMSVGYLVVNVLICVALLLLADSPTTNRRRERTISAGLLIVCLGIPTAYVSYWHLCLVVGVAAVLAGGRRFLRTMLRMMHRRLILTPFFVVSFIAVLLIVADLRVEQRLQHGLDRNLYKSALLAPTAGLDSIKHLALQVFVGEWRGVFGILSPETIHKFAAGNVPATMPMVTLLVGLLLVLMRRLRSRVSGALRRQSRFLIYLGVAGVVLLWVPIPFESLDVSDRNIFTHLVGMSAAMLVALSASAVKSTVNRAVRWGFRSIRVAVLTSLALNAALVNPASLRDTVTSRAEFIAPTSLGRRILPAASHGTTVDLVASSATSGRILSLTEAFDAQKYFQKELSGYVSYNDLTALRVATINAYPKVRNQDNIAPGFMFSSSLAPSSLAVSTADHCPIDQVRFLGTQVLAISTLQALQCRDVLSTSASVDTFVGTRDGVAVRIEVFDSIPVYVVSTSDQTSNRCPILRYECWRSLGWERAEGATLKTVFREPRSEGSVLRIIVSGTWDPSKWLVLPLSFDSQLRLSVEGTTSKLEMSDTNGYAAVRVTPDAEQTVFHVSIEPDIRMTMYTALPYAWVGAGLLVGVPWLRKSRHGRRPTNQRPNY